jgi:hypothetical protein
MAIRVTTAVVRLLSNCLDCGLNHHVADDVGFSAPAVFEQASIT